MSSIKIVTNKNKLKLECADFVLFDKIRQAFSCPNEKAMHSTSPFVQEVLYAISPTGVFLPGLACNIISVIHKIDPNIQISMSDEAKLAINPFKLQEQEIDWCFSEKFQSRDYQIESIKMALTFGRGLISLPTASGKSICIYTIIKNLLKDSNIRHILLLTPNTQLLHQMKKDFIEYGCNEDLIKIYSSFDRDPIFDAPIILSNRQFLSKKLKHKKKLPTIDAIIVDEVHQLSPDNDVYSFVKSLKTDIKYGFSGTLLTNIMARWNLIGLIGPILYDSKTKELQEEGFIADIKIHGIRFNYINPPTFIRTNENYNKMHLEEYAFIETNNKIIQIISRFVSKLKNNTMVFFDHTEHGHRLFEAIKNIHTGQTVFINGEVPIDDREDIRKMMEANDDIILVANCKAAGTGINTKNIHNIFFAMFGISETKIIQAIGRGLRQNENKTCLTLYDSFHDLKYSLDHFERRRELYELHYGIKNFNISDIFV